MDVQALTAVLKEKASDLGFTTIGLVSAQPARRLDAYLRWIDAEMHGKMGYMARPDRIIRRRDLNVILPGVQTIICVGLDYFTQRLPEGVVNNPAHGRIANYAWGVDYHDVMTPRLEELAAWLSGQLAGEVAHRVYVDTGAILERDHAEQAGLGFTGKNTMLIHPRRGSFFFLGEILITTEIEHLESEDYTMSQIPISNPQSPHAAMPSCGRCRRCLDACPTNAFPEPYVLDARRCISYLTIELKGWMPRALRPLIGNWIYGCDICQDVCPFNRFAQPTTESGFWPVNNRLETEEMEISASQNLQSLIPNFYNVAAPSLLELLQLDEAGFNERYARSPIKRIKHGRFLRNVSVAAGNWGSDTAVAHLVPLLDHPETIVRGHAAWALHQIGTRDAQRALDAALARETDPDVRCELAQETGGAGERSLL